MCSQNRNPRSTRVQANKVNTYKHIKPTASGEDKSGGGEREKGKHAIHQEMGLLEQTKDHSAL